MANLLPPINSNFTQHPARERLPLGGVVPPSPGPGFLLMLGTMFAPIQDRDVEGEGFTHKAGDVVTIANDRLGALVNTVRHCSDCAPWTFGAADLMRNLAGRGLFPTA